MPYPVFNNLRIRFGAVVLLAMLPAMGLMIFNSIEQRRMVTQHAQDQAQMLLLHAIQDQEQLVAGARQLLTTLEYLPQLQTGGWEDCGAFFSGLIQEYPQYINLGMAAANGDLICSAVAPPAPVNYADRQWFQDVLARRSFTVGEYVIGRVTGVALLPFAYPVLGEHGEITLVLFGGIDLGWLNALAARAELPEGTVLSVMDQNGTVLARSLSPEDYVGKAYPEAAIVKAERERSAGTAEIQGLDGVTRLYAYAPLSSQTNGETFISIGMPVKAAYAEGMRVLTRNLIILGVVTALVLAAAWFGGDRFILKPLRMLAGISRRLAAGELSVRARLLADYAELEELGSAFDTMAETLEQQEAQRVVAERKIKRQVETLTTLFEGSKTLVNNLDQRTLAAEITRVCVELFGSSLACLCRAHADGRLTLLSASGLEAGAKLSLPERWDTPAEGNNLVAQALQSRLPVVVDSTAAIPEGDFLRGIFGEKQQSILTVYPLASQGNAGFVLIFLHQDTKPLPQEEITARDSYANLAAGSLQNARLIEETETRLKNLQAINEIDRAISGSFSRELTLNVLIQKTIERMDADASSVLLLNPNTQRLEFAAGYGFNTDLMGKISLKLDESFAGRVALERRSLFIADLKSKEIDIPLTPFLEQEGFHAYQGAPLIAKGELIGVLQAFKRSPYLPDAERQNFFEILTSQAAVALESAMLFEKMQRSSAELRLSYDATIEGWARSLELRGGENEGHNRQAADLTVRLALALGVDSEIIPQLRQGALLHDIGMLAMPESMLLKPGALTDAEWKMLREHPIWAQRVLCPFGVLSATHFLSPLVEIPYCHHERWDGSGYPRGLKAESIPLGASIFAVVDVWEALNSDRPYRRAWKREEALAYMQEQAGKLFDPQVVEALVQHVNAQS